MQTKALLRHSMDFLTFSFDLLLILFAVAVLAGTLDTLAGGGGLITVPALLMAGVSPIAALATNKVQGGTGTAMASLMMIKKKQVSWPEVKQLMLASFIGATAGTIAVHFIDTSVLELVIPLVLFMTGLYFLLAPAINKIRVMRELKAQSTHGYQRITVPLIGLYDGMFGPGAGSFFTLAGVSLRKLPIIKATAQAKTLNFASNVASVLVYVISGKVVWIAGIVMMIGQMLGAWIGSHILIAIKPELLRWLVVLICFSVLGKYLMGLTND